MRKSQLFCCWWPLAASVDGFFVPPRNRHGRGSRLGGGGGDRDGGGGNVRRIFEASDDGGSSSERPLAMREDEDEEAEPRQLQDSSAGDARTTQLPRGGGATASKPPPLRNARARVEEFVGSLFRSKEEKERAELELKLTTMPVRAVSVPNTTVLPKEVVRSAVVQSGLLGSPLSGEPVRQIAGSLKRWYMLKGYVLHSVVGAKLEPSTGTAELEVLEPTISHAPVNITACKQMVIDEETGNPISLKQFKENRLRAGKIQPLTQEELSALNTTFVETKGRTRASKVARALHLTPGSPFCWKGERWQKVISSGVFANVLRASPERMPDGTVQLKIYAVEPPPRHLEYGIGKSLYTGGWEGEVDFEHSNLFGGGETVGVALRRGTKDIEPSVRLRYSDENFGMEGGYDVELFSEFIGDPGVQDEVVSDDYDHDLLLDRRGATFRLQNPIDTSKVLRSVGSVSVERTSTRTGKHESIASSSLTLGPFFQGNSLGVRSNIVTTVSGGGRATAGGRRQVLPFSSVSTTTRQLLPIVTSPTRRPMILALQHTLAISSRYLPRHEANALSVATQIRGVSPGPRVTNSLKGVTELRVPVRAPYIGEGSTVLFADWFCAQTTPTAPFANRASVGFGLRKNLQGFPLKLDVSLTSQGVKAKFGVGHDFSV